MRLIVTLGRDNYPTLTVSFQLVISQATCNCNLITWDQPAITTMYTKLMMNPVQTKTLAISTINAASEQASPAIRSCTGANACVRTSTVVLIDKAKGSLDTTFMSFNAATYELRVEPTVSSQIGTYTLQMTQTVNTGHAPIIMDSITVTVDCIIEQIRTPTTPATLVYNLMSSASVVDITPNFL